MRLNTAPDNPVSMGGIAHVSEFKIRNSAKAFGILSSGLYANKIRAIIRELGCNAVDSHVAAGRADAEFDVHLPTMLAPHFAIRDYGTGLNHDQVCNIYTTYFESTKADSNDFIGALGLGSKSPFSYTDNFTVTAIQGGQRGIYSAFINDTGVPSVALMGQDVTDEPDGVEVRFAVENRSDFGKFVEEAQSVFKHFRVKPNFVGAKVNIEKTVYKRENIIPGVHERDGYDRTNYAIMGHIEYPIDVPNAKRVLGEGGLDTIDGMGLDIVFNIGDIDFQASREGLQYTTATIEAIRKKYSEVAAVIDQIIVDEANAIPNVWDRRDYLYAKANSRLWKRGVTDYIKKTDFPLLELSSYYNDIRNKEIAFKPKYLAETFNIEFKVLQYQSYQNKSRDINVNYDGNLVINTSASALFIDNSAMEKVSARIKHHARETFNADRYTYIAQPADVTKPMLMAAFYAAIHEPPASVRMVAADIPKVPRVPREKVPAVSILYVVKDTYRERYNWETMMPCDPADINPAGINYYVALKGYEGIIESTGETVDAKEVAAYMLTCGITTLKDVRLYGVRKGDIEAIRKCANWQPIETLIKTEVGKIVPEKFCSGFVRNLDYTGRTIYNKVIASKVGADSEYSKFVSKLEVNTGFNTNSLQKLANLVGVKTDMEVLMTEAKELHQRFITKYPLIKSLGYQDDDAALVEYIQLVDKHKEVI